MKRRTADCGKIRRPAKRTSKITEGIYASTTFVYMKFLAVWAVVLMADFLVEFRFEYLWPFWLLIRSVYDSFKYQGLAFSMFFVLIALTSDMICFLFIPVHWLFFAASTYVWVQYVWHTDRGICLPTVSLWLLFVYIEASVRLKDLKSFSSAASTTASSSSPNLDLCRPFAAHCIGYPVVTLGFGVKSYLSYRMRLRKQKEVAKENEFYMELVQSALPEEVIQQQRQQLLQQQQLALQQNGIPNTSESNGQAVAVNGSVVMNGHPLNHHSNQQHSTDHQTNGVITTTSSHNSSSNKQNKQQSNGSNPSDKNHSNQKDNNHHHHNDHPSHQKPYQPNQTSKSSEYDAKPRSSTNSSNCSSESRSNSINIHNTQQTHKQQQHQSSQLNPQTNDIDFEESAFLQQQIMSAAKSKLSSLNNMTNGFTNSSNNKVIQEESASSFKANNSVTNNESCVVVASNSGSAPNSLSTSCSSTPSKWNSSNASTNVLSPSTVASSSNKKNKNQEKNHVVNNNLKESNQENSHQNRLESDIKRLKADLQASRQTEQELRSQVSSLLNKKNQDQEKLRTEVESLQQDNENLQSKLHNLVTSRQQDKANISMLEKKLQEEKKNKTTLETQLNSERESNKKKQKQDQQMDTKSPKECLNDQCKNQRKELENDLKHTKRELKMREDQVKHMEREAASLRQYKDSHSETEVLMSALSAMQDKNAHLENSLSAETRLKLDLFSALGDTKRQLEICQALMAKKDKEIDELKSKIAEVMACMPTSLSSPNVFSPSSCSSGLDTNSLVSSLLFNSKYLSSHHDSLGSSNLTTTSNGASNASSSPFSNME